MIHMKDFIIDLNDIIPVERDKKLNYKGEKRLPSPIMEKFSKKEIIFGFGLLKLLTESLKYLEEEDWKLIIPGPTFMSMGDCFENIDDLIRFIDFAENAKCPLSQYLPSVLEGLNELFQFAEYNQGINTFDNKTLDEFSDETNRDSAILFMENEEILAYFLVASIGIFDENIREIFKKIDFMDLLFIYSEKGELSYILTELNKIHLSKKYFTSLNMLINTINEFIDELCDHEFFSNIEIPFNEKKQLYREPNILRDKYLVEFLFNNTNFENYDEINIYDPCCNNINLIFNSIEFIKSKNNNCKIKFYGKLNFENSIFDTTKVIMYSYSNNDISLSCSNEPRFPFEDNISLYRMDFIISDYRANVLYEDNHFLHLFQYGLDNSSKLVMIFNKKDFYNTFMDFAILSDNLESIITFHDSFILILNSNKLDEKKNKFLLVDYTLLDNEFINYYQNSKSSNIENIIINPVHMNQILNSYVNFTDTSFSKVILNKDAVKDYFHTVSEKFWGHSRECPFFITQDSNEKVKKRGGYLELEKDMNYHLQEFNFNNLFYDLNHYSLLKRKFVENELNGVEEEFEFVPLYSLITFDVDELDDKTFDSSKIEKYGIEFYLKSDKILKSFLEYYLESDVGKEEYDYHKNSFGLDTSYDFHKNRTKMLIYMRIPEIDIKTQEKIINPPAKSNEESIQQLMYEINNKLDKQNDALQDIHNTSIDTNETVHSVDNKVDQLLNLFKEFHNDYLKDQKRIAKKLENVCSDEEKDKIMKDFSDEYADNVNDSIKDKINNTDDYKHEEQKLIISLGDSTWNKLQDSSKTFLTTSKITYNKLNELGDVIDYSGVCLLVTKALEVELTLRFYKRFIDYLREHYKKDYKYYHTSLLKQNPQTKDYYVKKQKDWSLGGIPYLFGYLPKSNSEIKEKNVSILIEYSKNCLFKDLDDNTIKETLYGYGEDVYKITNEYRNPAAHTNELKQFNAEECFRYVLDVEQVLKIIVDSFDKE